MAAQKQDDQHERTFSSYVRIRDVVMKTYLGRWTIGRSGERGSGISVLPARYDDDDDLYLLRAIFNKSWRQHSTKHQLYGHLPPITRTIKARRTKLAGYCWRSRDKLISDVLWTPSYGRAKARQPAWTYIQQLCEDTGCSPEDLPESMNDREKWREMVRDIRAGGMTWWWFIFAPAKRWQGWWKTWISLLYQRKVIHIYQPLCSSRIWHKVNF